MIKRSNRGLALLLAVTFVVAVVSLLGVTRLLVSLTVEIKKGVQVSALDPRVNLKNYENASWAKDFWTEYPKTEFQFTSFDLYERADFIGNAIQIVDGFRRTTNTRSETQSGNNLEVRLFGGSTTWGFGVNDENTIPSLINDIGGFTAKNYGEGGFVARQELARLINMYSEAGIVKAPLTEGINIFYDGVNEVTNFCKFTNLELETWSSGQIRDTLKNYGSGHQKLGFRAAYKYFLDLSDVLNHKLRPSSGQTVFHCADNKRAQKVAKLLIRQWKIASDVSKAHGDRFLAVLQPVGFVGDLRMPEFMIDFNKKYPGLSESYTAVYEQVRRLAKENDMHFDFLDLSQPSEKFGSFFIDYNHIDHNGNRYIADKIVAKLSSDVRTFNKD